MSDSLKIQILNLIIIENFDAFSILFVKENFYIMQVVSYAL